ncbi:MULTISPECIES: transposase domain-containing protein [unclassified Endozoicomonas]
MFQTLITSCLLAGIDPYKYLVNVLQRISLHPAP